jgi:hypothetical protein
VLERSSLATIATVVLALAAGCHEERSSPRPAPPRTGPEGVVRVALPTLPWPLDPAQIDGRDATTVARMLLATPLRTDPRTGALRPGLCRSWRSDDGARTWRFRCRRPDAIAAAIRRALDLGASPSRWLFEPIEHVGQAGPEELVVRLAFPWRRFPYALTDPAAAPRDVPGPFRVVAASAERIVAERPGLRLIFLRLEPRLAVEAFRRGIVDEAPVPLGDLGRLRADPVLRAELRVRPIRGVDLVDLDGRLAAEPALRLAYWRTAARREYEALVPEFAAPQAFGLVRTEGAEERASPARFRAARGAILSLPRVALTIGVADEREAQDAAEILWAAWREVGLLPTIVQQTAPGPPAARFRRLVAAYPRPEALLAELLVGGDSPSPARRRLLTALGRREPRGLLARTDAELQAAARVIPVAWVADARLVSRRLRGWRHDSLGAVDYTAVRAR